MALVDVTPDFGSSKGGGILSGNNDEATGSFKGSTITFADNDKSMVTSIAVAVAVFLILPKIIKGLK